MNKLTAREKCFCRFCAALGNPAQAAEWAGIPADQAKSILGREEAAAFVAACEGELGRDSPEHQLLRGVLRLVREGGNDAAVLMLSLIHICIPLLVPKRAVRFGGRRL